MFVLVGIGSDSRLVKLCIFGAANSGILKIPIRVWSPAPWSPTGLTFEERRLELRIAALSLFGCLWVLAGTGSKSSPSVAFARFVVWQCLCCLWFPLSFCRFGYWAGLVSNVTQGKSEVAVALCGAQQQSEHTLRKHSKKCFPPHQDQMENLIWESWISIWISGWLIPFQVTAFWPWQAPSSKDNLQMLVWFFVS